MKKVYLFCISICLSICCYAQPHPQMLMVGYNPSGTAILLCTDSSGNLATSGSGVNCGNTAQAGFIQQFIPLAVGTDGQYHTLLVDASGNLKTTGGSGGGGFPITLGSTSIASGSTTTSLSGLTLVSPIISGAAGAAGFASLQLGTTTPSFMCLGGVSNTYFVSALGTTCANGTLSTITVGSVFSTGTVSAGAGSTVNSSLICTAAGVAGCANAASVSPILNKVVVSPHCPTGQATCYQVNDNTQWVNDAAWSNGGSTVTTQSTDPIFTAGDVGKKMFGTGNCNAQVNCTLEVAVGTITTYNSAHSVTVSTSASAGCGGFGSCNFIWGTDDTAQIQAAWAAALASTGAIQLPCGGMMVNGPLFRATALHPQYGLAVEGCGNNGSSVIVPTPDFNWTGIGATGAIFYDQYAGSTSLTFSQQDWISNLFVWGGGTGTISGPAAGASIIDFLQLTAVNVWVAGWGWSTANLEGMQFNGASNLYSGGSNGGGGVGCEQLSNDYTAGMTFQGENFCGANNTAALRIDAGTLTSYGTGYYGNVIINGAGSIFYSIGDNSLTANGTYSQNNGTVYLKNQTFGLLSVYGGTLNVQDSIGNGNGIGVNTSGTVVINVQNSTIAGGNYPAINMYAGNITYNDLGNNTLTSTGGISPIANSESSAVINSPRMQQGACTGTATASSTIYLYNLGETTATTCTIVALGGGQIMNKSGTLSNLTMTAGTGGVSSSSGVATVLKNGSTTTLTCTLGTTTRCNDSTHTVSYVVGDIVAVQFTTQALETLANVKGQVLAQ